MIIAEGKNDANLMVFVSSIKNHINEWQIINVNIVKNSTLSQDEIMDILLGQYSTFEGLIYPVSSTKVVLLVRLGVIDDYSAMKSEIERNIPNHCCRILLRKMSAIGMKQVQIDLTKKDTAINLDESLYNQRVDRKGNTILIADDDSFVRRSMSVLLSSCGEIAEVDCGKGVLPAYLKYNPDIILLDIHMPDKTGLELIPSIVELDSDAFVIILSADSKKENVMKALELGAAGFLTKPPSRDKLQEFLKQCITIK